MRPEREHWRGLSACGAGSMPGLLGFFRAFSFLLFYHSRGLKNPPMKIKNPPIVHSNPLPGNPYRRSPPEKKALSSRHSLRDSSVVSPVRSPPVGGSPGPLPLAARISKDHSMPTRTRTPKAQHTKNKLRDIHTHISSVSRPAALCRSISEALPSRPMRAWPYIWGAECGAADANATPRTAPIRRPANRRASERRQARGREGEGARSSRAPRGARLSRGRTWRWST